MMKDKIFYQKVVQILRERGIPEETIWSFAFYHKDDEQTAKEYLAMNLPEQIESNLGTHFESKLVTINEENSDNNEHLDYYPLINARVH